MFNYFVEGYYKYVHILFSLFLHSYYKSVHCRAPMGRVRREATAPLDSINVRNMSLILIAYNLVIVFNFYNFKKQIFLNIFILFIYFFFKYFLYYLNNSYMYNESKSNLSITSLTLYYKNYSTKVKFINIKNK